MVKLNISIFFILILVTIVLSDDFTEYCTNIRKESLTSILYDVAFKKTDEAAAQFFILTPEHKTPKSIGPGKWAALYDRFNLTSQTVLLINGFWSYTELDDWKYELLEYLINSSKPYNIITVGWGVKSYKWNTVNSAQYALLAAGQIYEFFQNMKAEIEELKNYSQNIPSRELHIIGHGIGVHIGQSVSNLLKQDEFWKVKEFLGFEPVRTCYEYTDSNFNLSKTDAERVQIFHLRPYDEATLATNAIRGQGGSNYYFTDERYKNNPMYCPKISNLSGPQREFYQRECRHNFYGPASKDLIKCIMDKFFHTPINNSRICLGIYKEVPLVDPSLEPSFG